MVPPRSETRAGRLTELLRQWSAGDPDALDELVPLVDRELRRIASGYLRRERATPTLDQTTALVNEAYTRLLGQREITWKNRAHFLGITARIMRQILVDHARRDRAQKRGGPRAPETLPEQLPSPSPGGGFGGVDCVALHEALNRLEALDGRQVRIVELRFFGGLTIEETAELLALSPDTVKRDWRNARLWLRREIAAA